MLGSSSASKGTAIEDVFGGTPPSLGYSRDEAGEGSAIEPPHSRVEGFLEKLHQAIDNKEASTNVINSLNDFLSSCLVKSCNLQACNFAGRLLTFFERCSSRGVLDNLGVDLLVEVLHSLIGSSENLPVWRHRKDRGLKSLTDPVTLRLQSVKCSRYEDNTTTVNVEPLTPLNEVLRHVLRVTPITNESYICFCYMLVGCSIRHRVTGETAEVLSFGLMFSDRPLPIHMIRLANGDVLEIMLSLCDYEYSALSQDGHPTCTDLNVSLSLLHLTGGSSRYGRLLELLLDKLCRTQGHVRSTKRQHHTSPSKSEDQECGSDSGEGSSGSSSSSSCKRNRRKRDQRKQNIDNQRKFKPTIEEEKAIQRVLDLASLGDKHLLEAECRRIQESSKLAVDAAGGFGFDFAQVEPSWKVHTVNLSLPEEIPAGVFWPMVQEDIIEAVQEFYPRGLPQQVSEVLELGTITDGMIAVAQRLPLEEAEMLAARLSHLAQSSVSVDVKAVQERRSSCEAQAEFSLHRQGKTSRQYVPAIGTRLCFKCDDDQDASLMVGIAVGYGPPDAPWRSEGGASSLFDVISDDGIVWSHVPLTRIRSTGVPRGSIGRTSTPILSWTQQATAAPRPRAVVEAIPEPTLSLQSTTADELETPFLRPLLTPHVDTSNAQEVQPETPQLATARKPHTAPSTEQAQGLTATQLATSIEAQQTRHSLKRFGTGSLALPGPRSADILRGDLQSFARASDSPDPSTLLGHPVVERLSSDDLVEDSPETAKGQVMDTDNANWILPPKFKVKITVPSRDPNEPVDLPPDWNLLKAMQYLHGQRNLASNADAAEDKLHLGMPIQMRGSEKVPLHNWTLQYIVEPSDPREDWKRSVPMELDDVFALPPSAEPTDSSDFCRATSSTASEIELLALSRVHSFSSSSSPAFWPSLSTPRVSLCSQLSIPPAKRRRRAFSNLDSPSFVARDLYSSPQFTYSKATSSTEVSNKNRRHMLKGCFKDTSLADALELMLFLRKSSGSAGLDTSKWVSQKLDAKLREQLRDPLSVASGALPAWATVLPRLYPFLFSLETRRTLLRYTAFGPSYALHWMQQSKVGAKLRRREAIPTELAALTTGSSNQTKRIEELLHESSSIEDFVVKSDFWIGSLQSTLLRLHRNSDHGIGDNQSCQADGEDVCEEEMLNQADTAMELVASSNRLLEVQFDSETGFGTAVTRSFYADVARALQNRRLNQRIPLWVEDDGSASQATYLRSRCGLIIKPLPEGSLRDRAASRFRFLGRLLGKALKDGFIVPLPLPEAFFARVMHGSSSDDGLPRPGFGIAGELCGVLADFASYLRDGEAKMRGTGANRDEIRAWRHQEADRKDFTERFIGRGFSASMSFSEYVTLLGVTFLETGLGGVELCNNGAGIGVTVDNIDSFVELAISLWQDTGISEQVAAFRAGLDEVIPIDCFSAFTPTELRDLFCGEGSVEWGEQELLEHLRPSGGMTSATPSYQHLVAVLLEMDQANRSRFLDFVTSCPRLPAGGIDAFHVDVFPEINQGTLLRQCDSPLGFPRSRACANQLYLPSYHSKEELREKLHEAMHGSAGHHEHQQRTLASMT